MAELMRWQTVWRKGFAPQLSTEQLEAVAKALREDDPHLIQRATTSPPPQCVQGWPVEAACLMGYCGALANGGFFENKDAATVAECEEFFARACFEADQILGEPAACRHFLNWYDETPREEMRRELLAEVELTLEGRDHAN